MIKIPYGKNTYKCWDDLRRKWVNCPEAPVGGVGSWGAEEKPIVPPPSCSNFVENPANSELADRTMINITANIAVRTTYNISADFSFPPFRFFLSDCCENNVPTVTATYNPLAVSNVIVSFPNGLPLTQGYNVFEIQVTFVNAPNTGSIRISFEIPGCQEQIFEILFETVV